MELNIKEVALPQKIEWNYEELRTEITEKAKMYETMVYADDQIKLAKSDKAKLNHLKKALNDERISREREYMKPFNEFKTQVNEIISIIDKPVSIIDKQVKEYDEKKKKEKAQVIMELFEQMDKPDWLSLEKLYKPKWLNVSFSMKAVKEEIESRLEQINNDVTTLSNLPEFGFEATEVYKSTLDINQAVNEGKRLSEIQKRKEEQERLKAEAEAKAKAEAEAKAKAEAEAKAKAEAEKTKNEDVKTKNEINSQPDREKSNEQDNAQWISFSAKLTINQALELKEFFKARNIEFKAV